ncbi:hypothetical protein KK137_06435 [Croceibacterium sp. LX-88]|uniref:Uncharacterized protein n=1 Tax=Croceibacterium selenioxidans TaxID=2838833 RepID=A0ABS5W2J8_9SPHN|nr:hypothetical protein [Croceibacterium selenioxidans]MBT2133967.1 hypothetical protein [Croceibacterium selenioxidans]
MANSSLTVAAPSLRAVEQDDDFDLHDLRVFGRIPPDDNYDIVKLNGGVIVYDRVSIHVEGFLEGYLYVRESQHPSACMPWEDWLRYELDDGHVRRRAQPTSPLKTRREVVQAIRWPLGDRPKDNWAVRLASGHVDGPYYDWAFGRDFVGKVVGIYRQN